MFNELWFVPFGTQQLAGMRKPESVDEVNELKKNNVIAIISLLDDKENHNLYETAEMPFLWLPVTGGTAMTTEQAKTAYEYVNTILAEKSDTASIAVHCSNGHKRTGMLLAALQILNDTDYHKALEQVIANNPKAADMNEKQRMFLADLK